MTGISPVYAAWLACIAIYSEQSAFDKILTIGCDTIGVKQINGTLTITPLGTVDTAMWESNIDILPTYHPIFGNMHAGFLSSASAIYKVIKPMINSHVSFQGHSRGAALANVMASLCAADGIKVTRLCLFECPHPGYQRYADFCAEQVKSGMIGFELSTVNGLDPVPYLPIEPYVKSYPTIDLDQQPGGIEDIELADWHAGDTIYAGMQKMFPAP